MVRSASYTIRVVARSSSDSSKRYNIKVEYSLPIRSIYRLVYLETSLGRLITYIKWLNRYANFICRIL